MNSEEKKHLMEHGLPDICCPKFETTYLTKEELKVLYEHFKHEWISYENDAVITLMNKISTIVHNEELDTEGSGATC